MSTLKAPDHKQASTHFPPLFLFANADVRVRYLWHLQTALKAQKGAE